MRDGLSKFLPLLTKFLYDFHNTTVQNVNNSMQGAGGPIASNDSITISKSIHTITGTATVSQIAAPKGFQGGLILTAQDGFTLVNTGNIRMLQSPNYVAPNGSLHLTFHPNENTWWADTCRVMQTAGDNGGGLVTPSLSGKGISIGPGNVITNTGVTSLIAGTAIGVSAATGDVTVTNNGVTSIAGTANEITASAATGAVTLSLPATITGPTRYTGIAAPSATGDALSEGHAIGSVTPAPSVLATQLQLSPLTVATLPASPVAGMICYITNANTNTWGSVATPAGTTPALVWYNGTNWTVFAK